MTKIINNNLWSPVPWGWGCNGCNGGNNWLNNLFGYQMMFGMMNNMFSNLFAPQQRQQRQQTYNPYGSFYPGLSLGATQGNTNTTYEEYMERMQAQNDLAQLKQTWNEFKFSNIGGKFQAVLKADKSVILDGDTPDELMSNIIGYVNENPAQFKTKEKEGAGGVDEAGAGDGTVAGTGDDAVADTGNDTGDGNEDKGTVKRKVKRDWYIASNANNADFRKAVTYEALSKTRDKAADKAADALIKAWGKFGKTVNKKELIKSLIQNNKSIFDENGKLKEGADMNLFDVPTSTWAKNNLCKTNAQKTTISNTGKYYSGELKLWTGYKCETNYIKWNNNNNMIYKCGKGYDADSDLVLLIDGNHYRINGEDFYKALGLRDDSIWSQMAGGNSNIIDPKTGQFKTDGTWPSEGFTLSCVKEGNNGTSNLKGSKLTVENNKVVLIVGTNRFLMDNVMNGTIPCNQINGNKNNRYAES